MVTSVPYQLSSSHLGERRAELMEQVPAGPAYLGREAPGEDRT